MWIIKIYAGCIIAIFFLSLKELKEMYFWCTFETTKMFFISFQKSFLFLSRSVARNSLSHGMFLIIRAQILNSSERLNYMQTLPSAFLKNNYLHQISIVLADIQAVAYNFVIKRIPRGFNIFTNKSKDVMFLFLYYILGLCFLDATRQ